MTTSLVLVTAFKDDKQSRAVLVIVNNAPATGPWTFPFRICRCRDRSLVSNRMATPVGKHVSPSPSRHPTASGQTCVP